MFNLLNKFKLLKEKFIIMDSKSISPSVIGKDDKFIDIRCA